LRFRAAGRFLSPLRPISPHPLIGLDGEYSREGDQPLRGELLKVFEVQEELEAALEQFRGIVEELEE